MDIGSNAMRLLVADFAAPDRFTVVETSRVPVRLGSGAFDHSARIDDSTIEAAVAGLVGFRRRVDALGVHVVRAVATSALRESENAAEVRRRIADAAGFEVDAITGSEEARLVWLAVRARLPLTDRRWYLADLGGGSLEVVRAHGDRIGWSESYPIGTVRLLRDLADPALSVEELRARIRAALRPLRLRLSNGRGPAAALAITGGNAEALARLAEAETSGQHRLLPRAALAQLLHTLAPLSTAKRMDRFDLRADRADVIVPAGLVFEHLATLLDVQVLHVPQVGLKEGVVLDVVDDVITHGRHESEHEQRIRQGALEVGRRFRFNANHAEQVARLALSIFDQLSDLHGLGEADRHVLLAAALLHDIGQIVAYRRHHRHTYYLILHAELPGFSATEIPIVALVARYHRRSEPRTGHEGFDALREPDRERVRRLAAILRVADALDRDHLQQVAGIGVTRDGNHVRIDARVEAGPAGPFDRGELKSEMFERTYGSTLTVRWQETRE